MKLKLWFVMYHTNSKVFFILEKATRKKPIYNKNSKEALKVFLKIDDTLYNAIVLKNQSTLIIFILDFFILCLRSDSYNEMHT